MKRIITKLFAALNSSWTLKSGTNCTVIGHSGNTLSCETNIEITAGSTINCSELLSLTSICFALTTPEWSSKIKTIARYQQLSIAWSRGFIFFRFPWRNPRCSSVELEEFERKEMWRHSPLHCNLLFVVWQLFCSAFNYIALNPLCRLLPRI